jgi:hypothetical protein
MSWSLYSYIVKRRTISNIQLTRITVLNNLLAFILCALMILICYLNTDDFEIYVIFFLTFLDIPGLIITIFIVYFYYHIRKTLKSEYIKNNLINCKRRSIAGQLIAYLLVYSICCLCYIFYLLYFGFDIKITVIYEEFRMLFLVAYLIFNSIAYGVSKSTKKVYSEYA